jgi:hypothetical protein
MNLGTSGPRPLNPCGHHTHRDVVFVPLGSAFDRARVTLPLSVSSAGSLFAGEHLRSDHPWSSWCCSVTFGAVSPRTRYVSRLNITSELHFSLQPQHQLCRSTCLLNSQTSDNSKQLYVTPEVPISRPITWTCSVIREILKIG